MGKLDGRVALVTGAAQGIGAATAAMLAAEGARVAVCDRKDAEGEAVAAAAGGRFYHLDVSKEDAWTEVVTAIEADLGPVTVLVNNAGVGAPGGVQDTETWIWRRVMAVNVDGAFFGTRAVVPHMIDAGGGVIVNVSSVAGLMGTTGMTAYATSKWALRGLTKCSALEFAEHGIRVLSVHPGVVATPDTDVPEMAERAQGRPLSRKAHVDEVARMILFCITDATFSTGSEFVMDGGASVG